MNFECSHCNSRFSSERILREHMRHHVNHYKCPLCDMTCHSPSAVRDHVRYRHSQERSYQCPQCQYKAKSPTDLRRHSASHIVKEVFSCTRSNCDRVFKKKKELLEHYNTDHEVCKPYECHVCTKSFTRGSFLTTHLKEVHNYRWPSGHKRFRYKLHEDGIRRLQTIRYESIEVSQQVLGQDLSAQSTLPQQSVSTNDDNQSETNDLIIETASCHGDKSITDNGDTSQAAIEGGQFGTQEFSVRHFGNLKGEVSSSGNEPAASHAARSSEGQGADTEPKKNKRKPNLSQGNKTRSRGGKKKQAEESILVNESSSVDNSSNNQQDKVKAKKPGRKRKKGDSQELAAELQEDGVDKTNNTWLEVFYVDLDKLK